MSIEGPVLKECFIYFAIPLLSAAEQGPSLACDCFPIFVPPFH